MATDDPDIEVGPLKIWVRGWALPEARNNWDANMLAVTASCEPIRIDGVFVTISDVAQFGDACREAHQSSRGKIAFAPLEPYVRFTLESSDTLGHFSGHIILSPEHMRERHEYWFEIDQSFLPMIIQSCNRIRDAYPARDVERRS